MFDALFPTWSSPATIAAIVGLRIVFNGGLSVITVNAVGTDERLTMAVVGLTILSGAMTVLLLRPGFLGHNVSYVESLIQFLILCLAGYSVYANPSAARVVAFGVLLVCSTALMLLMIPLYGEAFVAP